MNATRRTDVSPDVLPDVLPDTELPDTELPDTELPDTELPDTELIEPSLDTSTSLLPHRLPPADSFERSPATTTNNLFVNLTVPQLYAQILQRDECVLGSEGALIARTGKHTGRAPKDKYIVRDEITEERVWWGDINHAMEPAQFEQLYQRVTAYLSKRDLFVQDGFAGADARYRLPVRLVTETAWHSLFARNLFITPTAEERARHVAEFTVLHAPRFQADSARDGTRSSTFVALSLSRRLILIGGTRYAGEIKKSIFTALNFLLPPEGVLTMHCSANVNREDEDDVALFFGLSGTGKTTLSANAARPLIGDDEHAWSDDGVFNLEGGCYAKVINLTRESEPEIYVATQRFGAVLENVGYDEETGEVDFHDGTITENTRSAYPLRFIPNATATGMGRNPRHVFMLTADAFGVMPPIAKLTPEQAVYHFLSGYTAKIAGTEGGVTEPQATFSTCFGAPFMILRPTVYADLLQGKIERHNVDVWLVNTGWSGGAYGEGQRLSLRYTRAMVRAALDGTLDRVNYRTDPNFGVAVPMECPDVPSDVLDPRTTWSNGEAYDAQASRLVGMFEQNYETLMASL